MTKNTANTLDETILAEWIGKKESKTDVIDTKPANFLQATFNRQEKKFQEGDFLPPAWHWMYFLEATPMDELGRDGHAALGNFLPPVALLRRMWAGARLKFHNQIIFGETLNKTSEIKSVVRKSGRSGELCFVTVNHVLSSESEIKTEEDHDIVYREGSINSKDSNSKFAPEDSDFSTSIEPSSTLLFRYSALTFNGHRIHYDLDFCRNEEGYPGLVVHAPLTATLMLQLARKYFLEKNNNAIFKEFNLKAVSPLFHNNLFSLHLKAAKDKCEIWANNHHGDLAMSATLDL